MPVPLRGDFEASQLRAIARKTKDAPQPRRLLALAAIYDQDPPPQQRYGPPCRGHAERRAGLRCVRLCAGHGRACASTPRPARRQGL